MMSFQVFRSIYENVVVFYKSFLNIKKIKKHLKKTNGCAIFLKDMLILKTHVQKSDILGASLRGAETWMICKNAYNVRRFRKRFCVCMAEIYSAFHAKTACSIQTGHRRWLDFLDSY